MKHPDTIYHFNKSCYIHDFRPQGRISFGLAAGFLRSGLTKGQQDDEMIRTAVPDVKTTGVLVGEEIGDAKAIQNVISLRVSLGIRVPYFIKCFSLGYSEKMYAEVDGDTCIQITDTNVFFQRFEKALLAQLPGWAALMGEVQYWDFSKVPDGRNQLDLMFLKDTATYSCQQEYRIVLLPPESFVITDSNMRQSIVLGPLMDVTAEIKNLHEGLE
jgi:hypothetical protein